MRTCSYAVVALALLLGAVMVAGSSSPVTADSCAAQLGSSSLSTAQYYSSSAQIVVPVSSTCSFSGGQLYAVGSIYDVSTNSNLGSANTILTSVGGGNTFNGQLVFNIPPVAQGDDLQISASIYNSVVNGTLLTSATETVQLNGVNYYAYPYYYWYYPSYPSYSPPSYSPPPRGWSHPGGSPPSGGWSHTGSSPPSGGSTPPYHHH